MRQLTIYAIEEQRVAVVALGKIQRNVAIIIQFVLLGQLVHFNVAIQVLQPDLNNCFVCYIDFSA